MAPPRHPPGYFFTADLAAPPAPSLSPIAHPDKPPPLPSLPLDPSINRGTAVPLYIALAAVGTFSAYHGHSRTGDCREALEAARNRARGTVGPQAP